MTEPSDFTVVSWALDHGWSREPVQNALFVWAAPFEETVEHGTYRRVHYPNDTEALAEMRRHFHEAHKPSLAERIADAVFAIPETRCGRMRPSVIDAVQRVLDEEGVK